MTKWVIKRSPYDNNIFEVWEYITDVEEAKKYWYISQAIRKYGEDKVVPLAMNNFGGYHWLPYDDPSIVCVVESEEEPTLKLFQQYAINQSDFHYGWLSPDCTSYTCHYMGHCQLASDICRELYNNKVDALADEFLLNNGWIKVATDGWYGRWDKINDKQVMFLDNKGIKFFLEAETYK